MDRAEEKQLIAQAQAGDRGAIATLYRAHVQAIYRYVANRVGDVHLAEDLTADVFTRALASLPGYQEMGMPFLAWLYRIAHARVVDHYRRRDRRPVENDLDDQPIAVEQDMDANLVQAELSDMLRQAIQTLTDDQQQVILLRFVEGYRVEAVARMMGKNANAIKALQHRALRTLASRLGRAGVDIETIMAGLQ